MRNKIMYLLMVVLLVSGMLMAAQPVSAHGWWGIPLKGLISAVDTGAGTLTVTPKDGSADVVLKVDSSTVITRIQKPATLADLQVGDKVQARYNPTSMLASRVDASLNLVGLKGTISAVDTGASTLTVTPKGGGTDVVLKVDSNTQIQRSGAAATLADLVVTDLVQAKYNPVTFLAATISAWPNLVMIKGSISAVDSGAGTLTITPKNGGADVALKVDSTTIIQRNGAAATLADLMVTDRVQAKYNPITMLAANISAWTYLVTLKGTIAAVDTVAGTVTVTPKDGGADVVLKVDTTTVFQRNGAAATLADLVVTDLVEAKYNPTSMLAANISAMANLVTLKGSIAAVDTVAGTVTVSPKWGADVVLKVDTTTVIQRNGATASLADLVVSDLVEAKYNPITMLAANISASTYLVTLKGTIAAVDTVAGTVTVTPKWGANVVLKVDTNTVIQRNGAAATLADLKVGDRVEAKYNPTSMLAATVSAWPTLVTLEGSLSAVDTGAGTLTVTPKGSGADVVLKVDSTTVINRAGHSATLADLEVGDKLVVQYDPSTMLAAKVWAYPTYVWIMGTISAVDTGAGTVTITPKHGGTDVVLKVDSTTMIRRNHHSATLADLQVGDHVLGMYDKGSMLAVTLIVMY